MADSKSSIKTRATDADVAAFLAAAVSPQRQTDGIALDQLFRDVTGYAPRMWGPSIIGYGRYAYRYESGHSGEMCATGFSPRKAHIVIYVLPGYAELAPKLTRLGKHRIGKSCLYINRLADIEPSVLADIIRGGLDDLASRYDIHPD